MIPGAAVEAAARATQEVCETYDPGGWTEEENWELWARQILEAAAPHIFAAALLEAAEALGESAGWSANSSPWPEKIQRWLRSRAASLARPGK